MKKTLLKTLCLVLIIVFALSAVSCKKNNPTDSDTPVDPGDGGSETKETKYNITYELNGGEFTSTAVSTYIEGKITLLPDKTTVKKTDAEFKGWYTNENFTGDQVTAISKTDKGDKKFYAKWESTGNVASKWELNTIGFDGQGMEIVFKVLPVSEYDPFDTGYSGDHQTLKQNHQRMVESAYNVKIKYSAWDNEAPWGPERVEFIKASYASGEFQKKGVYVVGITSQWVPTLVKSGCLAELYNSSSDTGIFADSSFNGEPYHQNDTVTEVLSVQNKCYGYDPGAARPDYFLYYNIDLAAKAGIPDPAELWFKGEWTWSKFDEVVRQAQTYLGSNGYAIDCGYAEFSIGAVAAQGNKFVNAKSGLVLMASSAVSGVFDKMKAFYQSGFWDTKHGMQDVATNFLSGTTIFHTGDLWFLKESTRFDPASIEFKIGMVPYPAADSGNTMTPYTEPYSYYDTQGNLVQVTEPLKGRNDSVLTTSAGDPIYGIDLSASSFKIPFMGISNYSIMDYTNGANGITPEVVFYILHDLVAGIGDDPNEVKLTNDEAYRMFLNKKLDYELDVDVVMSVQDESLSYYELMGTLSMTVGGGSHYGPNAFWPLAGSIMTSADNPQTVLSSVKDLYQQALEELGY